MNLVDGYRDWGEEKSCWSKQKVLPGEEEDTGCSSWVGTDDRESEGNSFISLFYKGVCSSFNKLILSSFILFRYDRLKFISAARVNKKGS